MRFCFSFRRRILAKQLGDFVRVYGKVYFSLLNMEIRQGSYVLSPSLFFFSFFSIKSCFLLSLSIHPNQLGYRLLIIPRAVCDMTPIPKNQKMYSNLTEIESTICLYFTAFEMIFVNRRPCNFKSDQKSTARMGYQEATPSPVKSRMKSSRSLWQLQGKDAY